MHKITALAVRQQLVDGAGLFAALGDHPASLASPLKRPGPRHQPRPPVVVVVHGVHPSSLVHGWTEVSQGVSEPPPTEELPGRFGSYHSHPPDHHQEQKYLEFHRRLNLRVTLKNSTQLCPEESWEPFYTRNLHEY